ncbi:MAG TPA: GTPase ObgE, partial [Prolixibacteraceae bacterium]|nr:GTPase ObgE [Prolixibacteraceae bacterium]
DHRKEYFILMDELGKYNPELLDKQRFLVISKADMLDDVLMAEISRLFPDIPHLFISSVSGYQIVALKDKIWQILKEN